MVSDEVGDLHDMTTILRPFPESALELLKREHPEAEHFPGVVWTWGAAQCLKNITKCDSERDGAHELVLDKGAKKNSRDSQLLLRIVLEESVLVEEVVNHACKDLLLAGI